MKTAYKFSVGNSERRKAAGKPRHRLAGNIKIQIQVRYRLDLSAS
jgi:hypothetical protein